MYIITHPCSPRLTHFLFLGLQYVCHTAERFYAVSNVLSSMVTRLLETPSVRLLKHIIRCYLRLSENLRARDALRTSLPEALRDSSFSVVLKTEEVVQRWLTHLIKNINETPAPGATGAGAGTPPGNTSGGGLGSGTSVGLESVGGSAGQAGSGGIGGGTLQGAWSGGGGGSTVNRGR